MGSLLLQPLQAGTAVSSALRGSFLHGRPEETQLLVVLQDRLQLWAYALEQGDDLQPCATFSFAERIEEAVLIPQHGLLAEQDGVLLFMGDGSCSLFTLDATGVLQQRAHARLGAPPTSSQSLHPARLRGVCTSSAYVQPAPRAGQPRVLAAALLLQHCVHVVSLMVEPSGQPQLKADALPLFLTANRLVGPRDGKRPGPSSHILCSRSGARVSSTSTLPGVRVHMHACVATGSHTCMRCC